MARKDRRFTSTDIVRLTCKNLDQAGRQEVIWELTSSHPCEESPDVPWYCEVFRDFIDDLVLL